MMVGDQNRRLLIDEMLEAKTEHEVDAAEKAADEWLAQNPADLQVLSTCERLAEVRSRLQGRRWKVRSLSLAASEIAFALAGSISFVFTDSWALAAVVAFVAGVDVAFWIWDANGLFGSESDPNS
jgi:hypothetical protein